MRAKINTQYTKRSLSQIGITINMISTDVDDTCIVMGSPNLFPILLCKYRILPCLAVYNTCKKSGRGRSLRPLFSRALYIHNTRQTGQYLIYTMVTMYKASTVQSVHAFVKTVKPRKTSFIKTVWWVLWAYHIARNF